MLKTPRVIAISIMLLAALLLAGQIAYSAQTSELKPEKNPLEVAISSSRLFPSPYWPNNSHLSSVPNLVGRDITYRLCLGVVD